MDISTTSTSQSCEISSSDVTILEGHTSEVKYFTMLLLFVNLDFLSLTVSSVKLYANRPVYHPLRFVLVHGVLKGLFLHQGTCLLHEWFFLQSFYSHVCIL